MYYIEEPGFWDFTYERNEESTEFLILTLLEVFKLDEDSAYEKVKELYRNGQVTIGTYTRDVCETFEYQLISLSNKEKRKVHFKVTRHSIRQN